MESRFFKKQGLLPKKQNAIAQSSVMEKKLDQR